MHKIDQIYGIERIGTELIIRTRESVIIAAGGDVWERFIRSDLEKIVKLISFYEMKVNYRIILSRTITFVY